MKLRMKDLNTYHAALDFPPQTGGDIDFLLKREIRNLAFDSQVNTTGR
jgi:hypothetical protein